MFDLDDITTVEDVLNAIADITILVCFIAALVFVVSYAGFFSWRRTRAGRAILYVFLAWLSMTAISGLARFIGDDYWGRAWFRVAGWGIVAFSLINLVVVLWRNFHQGKAPLSLVARHPAEEIPTHKSE